MDIQILLALQHFRDFSGGKMNDFFLFVTQLGHSILPMLMMAGIYWSVNKKHGRFYIMTFSLADFLTNIVKVTACVYRPWVRSAEIQPLAEAKVSATGYSFPSGHSTCAASFWGGMAYCNWKNKPIRIVAIIMVPLVMLSRLYCGVHTPQDVLTGCTIGLVMLWVTTQLLRWIEKDEKNFKWAVAGSVVLFIAIALYAELKSYPMDYVDGVLKVDPEKMKINCFKTAGMMLACTLGFYLENRYVKFTTDVDMETRIARFIAGGFVFIIVDYLLPGLLSLIFMPILAKTLSEFFIFFLMTFLCPWGFMKYEKSHAKAAVKA